MKYYIIAGEASGDLHGSNLMKGLYAADNRADCRYWGGSLMDSVYKSHQIGSALVHDYKDEAVIGFTQVLLRVVVSVVVVHIIGVSENGFRHSDRSCYLLSCDLPLSYCIHITRRE